MINKNKLLLTTTLGLLCSMPAIAQAETKTVTTHTSVHAQEIEGANKIDFSEFDLNKDGVYSKKEVGEKLFYEFDQDGNEVIDNIEWSKRNVFTITPMAKETVKFIDYDSDGITEVASYTYDEFYKESALILFDKNKDGLSAKEFINVDFMELDGNDNNLIDLEEWKGGYNEMIKEKNALQERYNK